ncbi:Sec-independent protein translocase subunit TatA [Corynebacterium sp. MSK041]|uniref:Sec-independent protein translocase subunit TatA n=1 Tax=Corynebacterium sp. MSK041 TaxID=3050194 RepID=UPI00254E5430|nr:Sec-independent protein translocase subunit TatA [Corynebacterium sp. MSK041]MDK8794562.1 Sec-independent protein translocase subunit TatA [Corynebacterium sp. MSK041]
MPNLGAMEILLIVFVILLLFGAAKLPDLARSVGRSARIFKSEVKEMQNDEASANQNQNQAPAQPRELTSGNAGNTAAQSSAEEGFWDRPENQRTNPAN